MFIHFHPPKTERERIELRRSSIKTTIFGVVVILIAVAWINFPNKVKLGTYESDCTIEDQSYDETTVNGDCGKVTNYVLHFTVSYKDQNNNKIQSVESCYFGQECEAKSCSKVCSGEIGPDQCNKYIYQDLNFYDIVGQGGVMSCLVSKENNKYSSLAFAPSIGGSIYAGYLAVFGALCLLFGVFFFLISFMKIVKGHEEQREALKDEN